MCCCGIEEAGRQSAKTAVTESRIVNFFKNIDVNAFFGKQLLCMLQNAHRIEVVVHHTTHQKFCREVVSASVLCVVLFAVCPSFRDRAHHSLAECVVQLSRRKLVQLFTILVLSSQHEIVDNGILIHLLVILQPSVNFRQIIELFRNYGCDCACLHSPCPVIAKSRRLVHSGFAAKTENILHLNDRIIADAGISGADKAPVISLCLVQVAVLHCKFSVLLLCVLEPAHDGVVVMSTCIADAVACIVMRQIVVVGA